MRLTREHSSSFGSCLSLCFADRWLVRDCQLAARRVRYTTRRLAAGASCDAAARGCARMLGAELRARQSKLEREQREQQRRAREKEEVRRRVAPSARAPLLRLPAPDPGLYLTLREPPSRA